MSNIPYLREYLSAFLESVKEQNDRPQHPAMRSKPTFEIDYVDIATSAANAAHASYRPASYWAKKDCQDMSRYHIKILPNGRERVDEIFHKWSPEDFGATDG